MPAAACTAQPPTAHRPSASDDATPAGRTASGTPGGGGAALDGRVVVLDPGHNPTNREHPGAIARQVSAGGQRKECDTTGTATNSGYAEAAFTLDVSRRVRKLLEHHGARVVLTHDGDRPYGPCVDERANIGNTAHADAAVSVHADGAGTGQRGFHVILPASVRAGAADTSAITGPSRRLGTRLASRFAAATGTAPADYVAEGTGLAVRDDLGGLNLSKVPKVFIECGNMRDPGDAAELTDARWRQRAATGIAHGVTDFLKGDRKQQNHP